MARTRMGITPIQELLVVVSVVGMLAALMFPLTCWLAAMQECTGRVNISSEVTRAVRFYSGDCRDEAAHIYDEMHAVSVGSDLPACEHLAPDWVRTSRLPSY